MVGGSRLQFIYGTPYLSGGHGFTLKLQCQAIKVGAGGGRLA